MSWFECFWDLCRDYLVSTFTAELTPLWMFMLVATVIGIVSFVTSQVKLIIGEHYLLSEQRKKRKKLEKGGII